MNIKCKGQSNGSIWLVYNRETKYTDKRSIYLCKHLLEVIRKYISNQNIYVYIFSTETVKKKEIALIY